MEANNKAMREALEAINCIDTGRLKRLLYELVEADIFDGGLINKTIAAVDKAKAVLSKPPRNCDVGTAEEQTWRMENRYCCAKMECCALPNSGWRGCPLYHDGIDCRLAWAQMPYEEPDTDK